MLARKAEQWACRRGFHTRISCAVDIPDDVNLPRPIPYGWRCCDCGIPVSIGHHRKLLSITYWRDYRKEPLFWQWVSEQNG